MKRNEILDAAKSAVTGKREQDKGNMENSFEQISKLWTAYKDVEFSPKDVAIMMALLKIARIQTRHDTRDSFIDACGYMACAGELDTEDMEARKEVSFDTILEEVAKEFPETIY